MTTAFCGVSTLDVDFESGIDQEGKSNDLGTVDRLLEPKKLGVGTALLALVNTH
jgi:hypothetical protein